MADLDEIFAEVRDGLIDNSRVNHLAYTEGWTPELALEIYYEDDARVRAAQGPISDAERAALLARIADWLAAHAGQSWHDQV